MGHISPSQVVSGQTTSVTIAEDRMVAVPVLCWCHAGMMFEGIRKGMPITKTQA